MVKFRMQATEKGMDDAEQHVLELAASKRVDPALCLTAGKAYWDANCGDASDTGLRLSLMAKVTHLSFEPFLKSIQLKTRSH